MQAINNTLKSDLSIESLQENINIRAIEKGERSKTCQSEEKLVIIMPNKNLNNTNDLNSVNPKIISKQKLLNQTNQPISPADIGSIIT